MNTYVRQIQHQQDVSSKKNEVLLLSILYYIEYTSSSTFDNEQFYIFMKIFSLIATVYSLYRCPHSSCTTIVLFIQLIQYIICSQFIYLDDSCTDKILIRFSSYLWQLQSPCFRKNSPRGVLWSRPLFRQPFFTHERNIADKI